MADVRYVFPKGFLWGTTTAARQVEGGSTGDAWQPWEAAGKVQHGHTAGQAAGWWGGRWREDFDRAAESGHNALRFSVAWGRVQPSPDRWAEDALEHYRQMARGLQERGITPIVTLHHFDDPLWFAEMGGWENDDAPRLFAAYAAKVVEALKHYAAIWCTFDEPNTFAALGYVAGLFPPGKRDFKTARQVAERLAAAHAAAYETIHRLQPEAQVGLATNYRPLKAARGWFPLDRALAAAAHRWFNDYFPLAVSAGRLLAWVGAYRAPKLANTLDCLGLNYTTTEVVGFSPFAPWRARRRPPRGVPLSGHEDMALVPEGLFEGIRWAQRFGVPIFITANGVEDATDTLRPRYLAEHLHRLWQAINFNWPVRAYLHRSLVDGFEWHHGWTRRFGLWALDRETQARTPRPSAEFYAAICRANALEAETVAQYAPDALPALLPGLK